MALKEVPCAYDYGVEHFYFHEKFNRPVSANLFDKGLEKRMSWIMRCGSFSAGYTHRLDYLKGNVSRYFFEALDIRIPKRMPWGWTTETRPLAHHSCYYLGTYPNYWSPVNKRIVYADHLWLPSDYPMGSIPEIPLFLEKPLSAEQMLEVFSKEAPTTEYITQDFKDNISSLEEEFGKQNLINYLYTEKMSRTDRDAFFAYPHGPGTDIDKAITDMAFFQKKEDIIQYLRQKYVLDERMQRFNACLKARYPKPEKEPQYKILDPRGPQSFPGIPTSEMELPQPTAQPGKPVGLERLISLRIIFNIIHAGPNNGYYLVLYVGEEVAK